MKIVRCHRNYILMGISFSANGSFKKHVLSLHIVDIL